MTSQFDKEGRYFAELSEDGKLKVWIVESNIFQQEYVPDLHLTSPCTCLQFLDSPSNENGSPRKKKKRNSINGPNPEIALGTTAGKLMIYSIAKGDINYIIDGNINQQISCLTCNIKEILYSGIEENIVVWDIQQRRVTSKWKSGNDKISAILTVPNSKKLLTASKSIKLWDVGSKTLLKTFSGHSSEIHLLQSISTNDSDLHYVISGSKGDRLLNCWNIDDNIKDTNATVSLLLEDSVKNVCIHVSPDGLTRISASIRSGIVHIFRLVLNGKSNRPIKPKSTVQVVSDTGQKEDGITSIQIVSSFFKDESNLLIAHGTSLVLTFENVQLNNKKVICLVREKPLATKPSDVKKTKVLAPIIGNNVHYVTPYNNIGSTSNKRKVDGKVEVSLEQRLENLTINKLEEGKLPRSNNLAQLLLQGLRSKDPNIIKAVMCRSDEEVIKNTVKRLPLEVITKLAKELTNFIKGKTESCRIGALWMKHLIHDRSGLLISNPDLPDLFAPMLSSMESRLNHVNRLCELQSRLQAKMSKISATSSEEYEENEEATLIFNDKDPSDSGSEMDVADSESGNESSEEQSTDDDIVDNDISIESDEEIST